MAVRPSSLGSYLGNSSAEFGCYLNRSVPHNLQVSPQWALKSFSCPPVCFVWKTNNEIIVKAAYGNDCTAHGYCRWRTRMRRSGVSR
jgi:hypothetical protein